MRVCLSHLVTTVQGTVLVIGWADFICRWKAAWPEVLLTFTPGSHPSRSSLRPSDWNGILLLSAACLLCFPLQLPLLCRNPKIVPQLSRLSLKRLISCKWLCWATSSRNPLFAAAPWHCSASWTCWRTRQPVPLSMPISNEGRTLPEQWKYLMSFEDCN